MGTKTDPGAFDCYGNAEPDEPMFILLGRDACAPAVVRRWAALREEQIALGVKPESDMAMVEDARACADAMVAYRDARAAKQEARDAE